MAALKSQNHCQPQSHHCSPIPHFVSFSPSRICGVWESCRASRLLSERNILKRGTSTNPEEHRYRGYTEGSCRSLLALIVGYGDDHTLVCGARRVRTGDPDCVDPAVAVAVPIRGQEYMVRVHNL